MECTTKFNDFITNISLTDEMKSELRKAYKQLRANLNSHEISKEIITTFLQGSYARHTGVKPVEKEDKIDVDLVVVTRFDSQKITPKQALEAFIPFLEKYYKDKYRMQGRSIGIKLGKCEIDLVPTAIPSSNLQKFFYEAFENDEYSESFFKANATQKAFTEYLNKDDSWKNDPLKIPDREAGKWDDTHPLAQIFWTQNKNRETDGAYIKVVRAIKWWKKNFCLNADSIKSYPLEHFVGDCCPSRKDSLANLITDVLKKIASFDENIKPYLQDRGVPQHDVFGRVSENDYKNFILEVRKISKKANEALSEAEPYKSSMLWRSIFGKEFPVYDEPTHQFTKREEPSSPTKPSRYA